MLRTVRISERCSTCTHCSLLTLSTQLWDPGSPWDLIIFSSLGTFHDPPGWPFSPSPTVFSVFTLPCHFFYKAPYSNTLTQLKNNYIHQVYNCQANATQIIHLEQETFHLPFLFLKGKTPWHLATGLGFALWSWVMPIMKVKHWALLGQRKQAHPWVLGPKLWSTARAANALSHWIISPVPKESDASSLHWHLNSLVYTHSYT